MGPTETARIDGLSLSRTCRCPKFFATWTFRGPVAMSADDPLMRAAATEELQMSDFRIETDALGEVRVPADKLWGAQTQRALEHFSIGQDLTPRDMITAYAILKKAATDANHSGKRLSDKIHAL